MFSTPYQREKSNPEINSGKKLTETAGYIPPKMRIEEMMLAGQRLDAYRKQQYHTQIYGNLPDEELPYDPTLNKDFDLEDATMLLGSIEPQVAPENPVSVAPEQSESPVEGNQG